ncbi:hypothetical protein ACO1GU_03950 [Fusobacterium watanabei]|uniref:hypothetical protein n=1 Tax=Fusobacterium watanabei TaxID=2686067 RepID=UPI003B58AC65
MIAISIISVILSIISLFLALVSKFNDEVETKETIKIIPEKDKVRILDENIEKIVRETIHSIEIECGKITEEEIELLKQEAYGEITQAEYFINLKKFSKEK